MKISITSISYVKRRYEQHKRNLKNGESNMLKTINAVRVFSVKFFSDLESSPWKNVTAINKPKYIWTQLPITQQ